MIKKPEDEDDGGSTSGPAPADVQVNYMFIQNSSISFNLIKIPVKKDFNSTKELNLINNISNEDFNSIKGLNLIKNKVNQNQVLNYYKNNNSIKSSYYYVEQEPNLNKEDTLNTKIINIDSFNKKSNSNNNYDKNNSLDYYRNDNTNNLDYYRNYYHNLNYDNIGLLS